MCGVIVGLVTSATIESRAKDADRKTSNIKSLCAVFSQKRWISPGRPLASDEVVPRLLIPTSIRSSAPIQIKNLTIPPKKRHHPAQPQFWNPPSATPSTDSTRCSRWPSGYGLCSSTPSQAVHDNELCVESKQPIFLTTTLSLFYPIWPIFWRQRRYLNTAPHDPYSHPPPYLHVVGDACPPLEFDVDGPQLTRYVSEYNPEVIAQELSNWYDRINTNEATLLHKLCQFLFIDRPSSGSEGLEMFFEFTGPFRSHDLQDLFKSDKNIKYPFIKRPIVQEDTSKLLQTPAENDLRTRSDFVFGCDWNELEEEVVGTMLANKQYSMAGLSSISRSCAVAILIEVKPSDTAASNREAKS